MEFVLLLTILAIGLAAFAFWIAMLLDCTKNEPSAGNDKVVWIIIIASTHIIGALIYYFARRRPRRWAQQVARFARPAAAPPQF
jgi:hypothetical protein